MQHSIPAEHAQHDLELIAGHAAGDLSDPERARGDALLASCTSCADLRRDLVAIAAATRTIPAQPSPRDFRLTDAQAARLRRGSWIKSLLRPFAAPGSSVRPMAMAFTSLGLAGLLVANILPALFGSMGASGAAPEAAPAFPAASAAAASAAAEPLPARGAGGPQATDGRNGVVFGTAGQPTAASLDQSGESKSNGATAAPANAVGGALGSAAGEQSYDQLTSGGPDMFSPETNWFLVGSFVLLAIGLALFGLRFVARRVR